MPSLGDIQDAHTLIPKDMAHLQLSDEEFQVLSLGVVLMC